MKGVCMNNAINAMMHVNTAREQHDRKGARVNNAINMTGPGTQTCAQTKHPEQQDRKRTCTDQGQEKTNANNMPNATGGRANSSTKHNNQTKNTACGRI